MTDIASLGIKIDSSQVVTGTNALDNLVTAAESAQAAEAELATQSKSTSGALAAQNAAAEKSAKSLSAAAASQEAAARAGDHFISSLKEQSALFSKSTTDVLRYRAAQLGVADAAEPFIASLHSQKLAQDQAAASALKEASAQQAAAQAKRATESQQAAFISNLREQIDLQGKSQVEILRYRAAQLGVTAESEKYIQAIERSNAATGKLGMSAKQTAFAMRQLPAQITDIVTQLASGSPAYLVAIQQGGQLRDVFGGFGNALKAVGSLLTPMRLAIGGAALAVIGFATALKRAQDESFELSKAIILSGNAAGVTKGQLQQMAKEIDGIVGTQSAATATLAQFAASGQVAGRNLKQFAIVAQQLKETVGKPVADTVKEFAELGRSPVEASKRLNQQYHYLTAAVYLQIKALEEQGRVAESGELAQQAYAKASSERIEKLKEELGLLSKIWLGLKIGASEAGDAIAGLLRKSSDEDRLAELVAQRGSRTLGSGFTTGASASQQSSAAKQRANDAEEASLRKVIKAKEDDAAAERASIETTKRLIIAGDLLNANRLAWIETNKQFAESQLGADVSAIQRQLEKQISAVESADNQLEFLRSADLIGASDYYARKRKLIEEDTAAQVKALIAENNLIRKRSEAIKKQAASDIKHTDGKPDKEPERIRIQGDADRAVLENQQKILDNEAKIFAARAEGAKLVKQQSEDQVVSINNIVRALKDETDELRLQAELGDHAGEAIDKLRRDKELKRQNASPEQIESVNNAERERRIELDEKVFANAERELKQMRMNNEERRFDAATRLLSADATHEQIQSLADLFEQEDRANLFASQFESIKQEFDAFSSDYVLSWEQMYAEIDAMRDGSTKGEEKAAYMRGLVAKAENKQKVDALRTGFDGLAALTATGSKKLFKISKAASLASATITAYEAINTAFNTKPWYVGLANGISAAGILFQQVQAIKNTEIQGFMSGGFTGVGPTDSVAGLVHKREFVMDAASTARLGVDNLNALRSGSANIESVQRTGQAANNSNFALDVQIIDQSTGKKDWDVEMMEGRMRIIAKDAATSAVRSETPKIVSSSLKDPNSSISKSMSNNVAAPRRRA